MRRAALVLAAVLAAGCGLLEAEESGPVTPSGVTVYEAELQQCARLAHIDGGRAAALACVEQRHREHCGEGGDWTDAGVCDAGIIPQKDGGR